MVKTVFFDLWGTLIESLPDPIITIRKNFGLERYQEDYLLELFNTVNSKDVEEYLKQICSALEISLKPEQKEFFKEIINKERKNLEYIRGAEDVLRILRKRGYKIGIISNLWGFIAEEIFEKKGLNNLVDAKILSFEEGIAKPNKNLFNIALKRTSSKPKDAVMVGDSMEKDIMPARGLGMNTILISKEKKVIGSISRIEELRDIL